MTLSPSKHSATRRKWRRWLSTISAQVATLCLDDEIFRRSMKAIEQHKALSPQSHVYGWILRAHSTHLAIGLRRLLDSDTRTYSLLHLVRSIARNPQVITRRSFIYKYPPAIKFAGHQDFDKIAGHGADYLPARVPAKDLDLLESTKLQLNPGIDKAIAHAERYRGTLPKRTWQDFHDAVHRLDEICCRYTLLLEQGGCSSMMPTVPDLDQDLAEAWGAS